MNNTNSKTTIKVLLGLGLAYWLFLLLLGLLLISAGGHSLSYSDNEVIASIYILYGVTLFTCGIASGIISICYLVGINTYNENTNIVTKGILCIIFANIPAGILMIVKRHDIINENKGIKEN